jgi:Domain of unknown function (DUF4184)
VPFTLSHPAAVLPLGGRRVGGWSLALPPLVAGSMAPDVPYYTPLPGWTRAWTHSFLGAFTCDVLLAVVLLGVGVFVAGPVAAVLPWRWKALVGGWTGQAWPLSPAARALVAWYLTLALGALTHVCWDAFTHPDGQVVTRVPALSHVVAGRHLYALLQLGSTIVGGAIVLGALWLALRRTPAPEAGHTAFDRRPLLWLAGLTLGVGVLGAVAKVRARVWWTPGHAVTLFDLVTGFLAGCTLALLTYAAVRRLAARRGSAPLPG